MLIKKGLTTAIVLCAPDVLRAEEHRAAYMWVADHWQVERHVLAAEGARVTDPVPRQFVGPVEVHVDLRQARRAEECLRPQVWISEINPPVSAVAKDGDKPVALRTERLCPIILRPTHDIGTRSLGVNREAL